MENNETVRSGTPDNDGHLFEAKPTYKLYNDHAIAIGTFIGGPIVGGYLMATNFKALGERENMRRTWLIAVGTAVVIFAAAYYLPFMEDIPGVIIPLAYTGIAQALYKKYQGEAVKQHVLAEGELYSAGRGALFGLIGLVLFVAFLLLVLWLAEGVTIFDLIEAFRS